jgi:hypothetical protein
MKLKPSSLLALIVTLFVLWRLWPRMAAACGLGYRWAHSSVCYDHHAGQAGYKDAGHYNGTVNHSAYYKDGAHAGHSDWTWPYGGAEADMAILDAQRRDYW